MDSIIKAAILKCYFRFRFLFLFRAAKFHRNLTIMWVSYNMTSYRFFIWWPKSCKSTETFGISLNYFDKMSHFTVEITTSGFDDYRHLHAIFIVYQLSYKSNHPAKLLSTLQNGGHRVVNLLPATGSSTALV